MTLYNRLRSSLTAQILTAVNATFLRSGLEDPDFGFGDVSPRTMLTHLKTEYGTMTPEELDNCAALPDPWNLDDPVKDLWANFANIQHVAAPGNVPIPDVTVITSP